MDVTDEFLALVSGSSERVPLDVATLLVAAHASPDLNVAHELGRLDQLAEGCPVSAAPGSAVEDLRLHLFGTIGFTGDRLHYEDPRNSLLDQVLTRRVGIPITLSVVMLEVGRRLGIELFGVGMPGHFLVSQGNGRYIDPFDGGRLLDAQGCRRQYHAVLGADAPWDESFLAPVGVHTILARILANLRQLYASANDLDSLSWVLRLRSGVPGVDPDERLDLAGVLSALGRYDDAARALEELALVARAPEKADALRGRAVQLRSRLN
jgi:regulator of sirC expression with transglutaminase-like and TPR domain